MGITLYTADQLFDWLITKQDILFLDVRNSTDFSRFKVESPFPFEMVNISYFDFMEIEDQCIAKLPKDKPIRVICAKEGSARFVAEILEKHNYSDIGYLQGGIKSWGNVLIPKLITTETHYQLYQFIRPGKASCSYGLHCGDELVLFDPSRNIAFYQDFAQKIGAKITTSFETHLQADYIAGSRLLQKSVNCEFFANPADFSGSNFSYTSLTDQQEIRLTSKSAPSITVLFTPGHTPGSTSYLIDDRYLLTGDTVFLQSVGRPDLGGMVNEWSAILFSTLQKIRSYDPGLHILPGHYINWKEANADLIFMDTLGNAIATNKDIFELPNSDAFLKFIQGNMREQPPEYATIRKVNANLVEVTDEMAETLDLGKNECAASAYAAHKRE